MGNKTKETDPGGKAKTYEYDDNNRLTKITDALGNATQFLYNTDGKLIKQTDQEGRFITYEYDLDGRLTKTIDGNGNEITTQYNDVAGSSCSSCSGSSGTGQPSKTIYPTYSKEYNYDKRGRKIEEKDVLSTTEAYSTQFTYDAAGNLTSQTDKESKTATYQYDELGRRVKVIDPLTGVTEYTFDKRDNLVALKDAKGNTTAFEYDRNNRVTKETRPLGQATTYQYDAAGNLTRKTDAKNQKTEYEYDDAGRLITTKYFASATDTTLPRPWTLRITSLVTLQATTMARPRQRIPMTTPIGSSLRRSITALSPSVMPIPITRMAKRRALPCPTARLMNIPMTITTKSLSSQSLGRDL